MAWWDKLGLGQRVERGTALLPMAASLNIFTIVGGKVLMTSLVGEITAAIGAVLNQSKLLTTPTLGSPRDICADLDTQSYAEGDLLGITGINTDAMIPPATDGCIEGMTIPVILKAGVLTLECDGNTVVGKVKWTLHYIPIDDGAYVEIVAIP